MYVLNLNEAHMKNINLIQACFSVEPQKESIGTKYFTQESMPINDKKMNEVPRIFNDGSA